MLIRIATDDDGAKWDHFVSHHSKASPYHRFAWKTSIQNSYSHKCYYLIAEDKDGNIVGILPSALIKPPLTSGQLCSLPFCDRGESLTVDSKVEQALMIKAHEIAAANHASYEYRASGNISADNVKVYENGHKVRMLLELPESSDTLLASFKSKLRSQVKKAEKNGLDLEIGRNSHLIDAFYKVFTINMRDLGSPTHSKKWFQEITRNYQQNMIISIIKYNNQPVGAGMVLFNGVTAAIPWASTKREFNRLSPNMMLYWSLLRYATDHGYKVFDFGRSGFGEGTYRFKQQWGAYPVPLQWETYKKNLVEPQNVELQRKGNIRPIVESIWRHLPLPMTVKLGSGIRKYISL